jgi:hypothetical protein
VEVHGVGIQDLILVAMRRHDWLDQSQRGEIPCGHTEAYPTEAGLGRQVEDQLRLSEGNTDQIKIVEEVQG